MIEEKNPTEKEVFEEFKKQDPYAGIILEEMNDKLSIIIDGYNILEHKIDRVDAKLDDFKLETTRNFNELFKFRDETRQNFKIFFAHANLLDEEKAEK